MASNENEFDLSQYAFPSNKQPSKLETLSLPQFVLLKMFI